MIHNHVSFFVIGMEGIRQSGGWSGEGMITERLIVERDTCAIN